MSRFEAPRTPPRPIPVPTSPLPLRPRPILVPSSPTPLRPRVCTPDEFELFGLLPSEIRLKIWAFALPPPRLVHIHYDVRRTRFIEYGNSVESHLVHVNVEARQVVFEHYKTYFSTRFQRIPIYADLKIDQIAINWQAFRFSRVGAAELLNLQFLQLSYDMPHLIRATEIIRVLSTMPNLKQLMLLDPRSPYTLRPFPTLPLDPNDARARFHYYIGVREHDRGQVLERRYYQVWEWLIKVDLASRLSQYGLSNFRTGIVGYDTAGRQHSTMVCALDHEAQNEAQ